MNLEEIRLLRLQLKNEPQTLETIEEDAELKKLTRDLVNEHDPESLEEAYGRLAFSVVPSRTVIDALAEEFEEEEATEEAVESEIEDQLTGGIPEGAVT